MQQSAISPDRNYIHIPLDLLQEVDHFRCPPTVNLEMNKMLARRTGVVQSSPRALLSVPNHWRSQGGSPRDVLEDRDSLRTQGRTGGSPNDSTMSQWRNGVSPHDSPRSQWRTGVSPRATRGSAMFWGHFKKVVPIPEHGRMESDISGDPRNPGPDSDFLSAIASVAQANDVIDEGVSSVVLPELRSSPCPIYNRGGHQHTSTSLYQHQHQHHHRHSPSNNLLYNTSSMHGHSPRAHRSTAHGSPVNSAQRRKDADDANVQIDRDKTFHRDVRLGKAQKYARPVLPVEMTSHDFVKSWLRHGSSPRAQINNHFPDLPSLKSSGGHVSGSPTNEQNTKKTPRKNDHKSIKSEEFTVINPTNTDREPKVTIPTGKRERSSDHISE